MALKRKLVPLLMGLICLGSAHSRAATEAVLNYSGGIGGYALGTGGWTFQVQTDVSVTSLGCFDYLFLINPDLIQVGLWAPDGSLLASSAISSNSPLFDLSRYEAITPVTLVPKNIYHLGAYSSAGVISLLGVPPPPEGSNISMASPILLRGYAASSPGFVSPNELDGADGAALMAPNFQFSPVPEPAPSVMLGLGGLVIVASQLRRARH